MRTRTFALLTLLAAALAFNAPHARAASFSSIVVYGDSLSDNGNLYKATGGVAPAPPYVNGRFSNGPVSVEQLSTNLQAQLYDFAYGGATTGVGNIGDYGTPSSLGLLGLPGIKSEFGASLSSLSAIAIPSSLFIVWGGADDFEALFEPQLPTPNLGDILAAADTAAQNIDGIASTIQSAGGSNILVPNLPNLGGTPEFGITSPLHSAAIAYSDEFNKALAADLPAGATLFDTNALFGSLLSSPSAYGLTNTTDECIQDGANPNCTGYLFFDDIHPTTAVDTILAQDFAAAVVPAAATPEPSSLMLLGTGILGATGFFRRKRER